MRLLLLTLFFIVLSNGFCNSILESDVMLCGNGEPIDAVSGCCTGWQTSGAFCPPGCSGSMSSGSAGAQCQCTCNGGNGPSEFLEALSTPQRFLKAHNYLRCRHGFKSLLWDSAVEANAQNYADTCPFSGGLQHSHSYDNTPSSGENLASGTGRSIEGAVEAWYDEIKDWVVGTQHSKNSNHVGHFTAMMWKSTTKLGCGTCALGNTGYQICHYAENPPNSGEYAENLPTTAAYVNTEEYCCEKNYLDAEESRVVTEDDKRLIQLGKDEARNKHVEDSKTAWMEGAKEEAEKKKNAALEKRREEAEKAAAIQKAEEEEEKKLAAIKKAEEEESKKLAAIQKAEEEESKKLAAIQKAEEEESKKLAAIQKAEEEEAKKAAELEKAACKDVQPPIWFTSNTCAKQKANGKCAARVRKDSKYCRKTCGLCGDEPQQVVPACHDIPPPDWFNNNTCEKQKAADKCKVRLAKNSKYCRKTCGLCSELD